MPFLSRTLAATTATLVLCFTLGSGSAFAQLPEKVGETPIPSLAPIIKKASPAVVNIATRGTIKDQGQSNPLLQDPFFRRFFDVPDEPRERQFQSAGSGVIIDAKNGLIITNAHVIENATEITVTLLDNRSFKAEVVGSDPGSDIAVLKTKTTNLAEVPLADSSRAEVGDFVVAIGNPFGLQHTVTSGIISALGRSPGISPDSYEDFIQTDASINPGNSGGALINLRGELVGINSAILSRSGGNIGIGFAIPSNMVKSVMDQIVKYGEVRRGVLGVSIATLTPDVAKSLGVEETGGVLVSQVAEGSAADKAGIKAGDVVTSINNKAVRNAGELRNVIGLLRVGEKVDLGIVREGKPRRVTASIGDRDSVTSKNAASIHRGLEGAELADAGNNAGVVVRAVAERSPAAQNGLRANDLIIGVGRVRVTSVAQLKTAIADAGAFAATIQRDNATIVAIIQ